MGSRPGLTRPALLLLLVLAGQASAQCLQSRFSVQVASFPNTEDARRYALGLASLGETVELVTVELQGRGKWTRVLVGCFSTISAARKHGIILVNRGLVSEFLTVPRNEESPSVKLSNATPRRQLISQLRPVPAVAVGRVANAPRAASNSIPAAMPLPRTASHSTPLLLVRSLSSVRPPLPDPTRAAISFILGVPARRTQELNLHGLWISGDLVEAGNRLRWIAGPGRENFAEVGPDGHVRLDWQVLLDRAVGADTTRADAAIVLADYIASDEGLLLLVQLIESPHCYRLHIGREAPTRGGKVAVRGGINLDNNFDSRINPLRRNRKKLDSERPPAGFDSLVGLNPDAHWLNVGSNSMIPQGHITFHELAEAQAKLELGLDYLGKGGEPGAHEIAIQREWRLKSVRPARSVVVTTGPNRIVGAEGTPRRVPSGDSAVWAKR